MPEIAQFPAFDFMTAGLIEEDEKKEREEKLEKVKEREAIARTLMKKKIISIILEKLNTPK